MKKTLYVSRQLLDAEHFINWAKEQGFNEIKNDPHVTLAYSREPVNWSQFRPHESN